jgi:hypothetical protein
MLLKALIKELLGSDLVTWKLVLSKNFKVLGNELYKINVIVLEVGIGSSYIFC